MINTHASFNCGRFYRSLPILRVVSRESQNNTKFSRWKKSAWREPMYVLIFQYDGAEIIMSLSELIRAATQTDNIGENQIIRKTRQIVREKNINVSDIAHELNVIREHFTRILKMLTNTCETNYVSTGSQHSHSI